MSKDQQKAVAEEFDGYDGSYSEAVNKSLGIPGLKVDFFTRVKAAYLEQLVSSELGQLSAQSVLDIGCGVGNFHSILQDKFQQLSGVDVSEKCLGVAKAKHPIVNYELYDGSRLPYDDDQFDVVFTVCVMHHVPSSNWPAFAAEMRRVLRPGGLAVVFEHNPLNPLTMRAVNRCPFDADAELLPSKRTVGLFQNTGFAEVKRRFILTVPAVGRGGMAVDRLFSRLGLGAQYYVAAKA